MLRGESGVVSNFTSQFITPLIISQESNSIRDAQKNKMWRNDAMTVSISPSSRYIYVMCVYIIVSNALYACMYAIREVISVISVEEHSLEVVIKLPADYPLRTVEVEVKKSIGIKEERWRRLVSISYSLIYTQISPI